MYGVHFSSNCYVFITLYALQGKEVIFVQQNHRLICRVLYEAW